MSERRGRRRTANDAPQSHGDHSTERRSRNTGPLPRYEQNLSHVEAEVDDVAILHDVVLALDADLAFLACGGDAAGGDEVVVVDDLGADEAALEVRMDLAGGFRCRRALDNGPGAALIRAGRQEGLQAQEVERCLDQAVEAALRLTEVFEEGLGLFFVELGDLRLDFCRDGDDFRALFGRVFLDLLDVRVLVVSRGDFVLGDVRDVERRLERQEVHLLDELEVILGEVDLACRRALVERSLDAAQDLILDLRLFVAGLRDLRELHDALLDDLEVSEAELRLDDVDVAQRVDAALDMRDVRVDEAAHDVCNGIDLADVLEEFIAEALALGRALDEAGDVDEAHGSRRRLLRVVEFMQDLEARVWYGDDADIRLDRAEREVRGLCAGFRDGIEKRALADVRQADNTNF